MVCFLASLTVLGALASASGARVNQIDKFKANHTVKIPSDCEARLADGACCVWFSDCSCCDSGDSEAAMFECWSARKCAKKPLARPKEPSTPWRSQVPYCYAPAVYFDYYKCRKGRTRADLEDFTKPRNTKPVPKPDVTKMGMGAFSDDASYTVTLDTAKGVGDRMFGVLEGINGDVMGRAASLLLGPGSILYGWLKSTINALVADPKDHIVNLKPYFQRFEKHLNRQSFKRIMDEIQTKYEVFLSWFTELRELNSASADEQLLERLSMRSEVIVMQLDLAGALFTRNLPVDVGLSAYYLFEPLFNHASLHMQVIFYQAALFAKAGDRAGALRRIAHAKRKHDYYKEHLESMRNLALPWRLSMVKAQNKPFSAANMCKQSYEQTGTTYDRKTWTITYQWEDNFYNDRKSYRREEKVELKKENMGSPSYNTFCFRTETDTDGRQMLKEAEQYLGDLKEALSSHYDRMMKVHDAVWDTSLANLVK